MKHTNPVLCITISCIAAGCASQPLAASEVAAAERAIDTAQRSGAAQWAPRELGLAEEKMALMRRWRDADDPTPARWLAREAQVDAELAAVKAMRAAMRKL